MTPPLKVLLLNTQMEAGGAQKAMLLLAQGLQARGHCVHVVTMYDKGDFVAAYRKQYGVDILDLRMKQAVHRNPLQKVTDGLRGLLQLYRLMRSGGYNVVQTFSHYSNIIGPVLAWLARVPIRVSSQRMSLRGAPSWVRQLDRLVTNSRLVTAMVMVSEGTRRYSIEEQGLRPEKLVTIHNSIDLERFTRQPPEQVEPLRAQLGLPDDALIVTTVARLHPQKGHRYLLQAAPAILAVFPQTHFLLVGEGALWSELEMTVRRLGLQEAVHFLGVRQDIPTILSFSDIFVLPSLWEGLPNSVLEAMATETAVVATDVDGTPEVVQDGKTGLLVPPANVEALQEAIAYLLGNATLRQEMGSCGRNRVAREFSHEKNIASFLSLYMNCNHSAY